MNRQAERDRVFQILSELDEQLQIKRADLSEITSKWSKNLTNNESDSSSNPGDEENFGGSFDEDLGGTLDGDLINEDASDSSRGISGNVAESSAPRRTSRRKRRAITSFPHELNLRKHTKKNYNVGSPSRKRRHPKP